MRYFKTIFLFILIMNTRIIAQKQTFDIVSYTPTKGWTETRGNDNVSYSRIENGNWAQIVIYKSTESAVDIDADFDKDWNELVSVNKTISSPQKAATYKIQTADYIFEIKEDPNYANSIILLLQQGN